MNFDYEGLRVNILDTPGHQDFSEDTYRALAAGEFQNSIDVLHFHRIVCISLSIYILRK